MAENANGVTPATAATPPNDGHRTNPPTIAPPAGAAPEGKVTISTKEYADLQRAKARTLSFENRRAFNASRNAPPRETNGGTANEAEAAALSRADNAERRVMQLEVKDKVRELLGKPEYAVLPQSTRDLILKNPAMLSEADNIDEALLDIEDFVLDSISKIDSNGSIPVTVKVPDSVPRPSATPGHETPPARAIGPSDLRADEKEDINKLTGTARSRAILRNKIRDKRAGV